MNDDSADEAAARTTGDRQVLDGHGVAAARLDDWRLLFAALHARYRTGSFARGMTFVERIAAQAEKADHHPDVDLHYGFVRIRLTSHDVGGVTERDIRLARVISEIADGLDLTPETGRLQVVEVGLDSADAAEIKPFWAAVLGLADSDRYGDELVDPDGVLPTLWFQETDPHDPPRQRFHFDVRVAPEQAEQAGPGRDRGGRDAGQRCPGAALLGSRRPAGQQGLHHHLAGARRRPRVRPPWRDLREG